MSEVDTSAPAPLRLPAILQNPTNTSLKQVEAYNAQQREKLQARREAKSAPRVESKLNGKGKRVIRRLDNAQFTSNPHIQPPLKSDYYPNVPLQPRPSHLQQQPLFPSGAIPRKENIPSIEIPRRDPNSNDSINGNFNLSLKGTRALLKKRGGKRVESLIGRIEGELRGWLNGDFTLDSHLPPRGDEDGGLKWKIIDDTLIDQPPSTPSSSSSASAPSTSGLSTSFGSISQPNHIQSSRRLPPQHRITGLLPPLPKEDDKVPGIIEISRSAVHLSWFIVDPFERLVVHLLARYYELHSWSESYQTISNETLRITHIIIPNIIKPRIPTTSNSNNLMTPETSELSSQSGPESDLTVSESSESDSDTATEKGDNDEHEIGYSLEQDQEGDRTITSLPEDIRNLQLSDEVPLTRSISNISNNSSAYASSEGGNSDYSLLNDSLTLPPNTSNTDGSFVDDGWSDFGGSDLGLGELPKPPLQGSNLNNTGMFGVGGFGTKTNGAGAGFGRKTWEDKPTFFEYLYGV